MLRIDDEEELVLAGGNGLLMIDEKPQSGNPPLGGVADEYPVGSVHYFTGDVCPDGFLLCDGATYLRAAYPRLAVVLDDRYGSTGPSDFKVPDYRGVFLRFSDFGSGADPDNATRTDRGDGSTGSLVGTRQADLNLAHTHTVSFGGFGSGARFLPGSPSGSSFAHDTFDVGGNENRPKNVNLMGVIKY